MNQKIIDEIAASRVEIERIKNRITALEAKGTEFKPGWYLCWDDRKDCTVWLAEFYAEDAKNAYVSECNHIEPVTPELLSRFLPKPATRYDWSKAPEWAQCAVRNALWSKNSDRSVWLEDCEPEMLEKKGRWAVIGEIATIPQSCILDSSGDWRDSLEKRP